MILEDQTHHKIPNEGLFFFSMRIEKYIKWPRSHATVNALVYHGKCTPTLYPVRVQDFMYSA